MKVVGVPDIDIEAILMSPMGWETAAVFAREVADEDVRGVLPLALYLRQHCHQQGDSLVRSVGVRAAADDIARPVG